MILERNTRMIKMYEIDWQQNTAWLIFNNNNYLYLCGCTYSFFFFLIIIYFMAIYVRI